MPLPFAEALVDAAATFTGAEFPGTLFGQLVRGSYLVAEGFDELGAIQDSYWQARNETPVVLTITTTTDCNLGCYYCYQERGAERLATRDILSSNSLADA